MATSKQVSNGKLNQNTEHPVTEQFKETLHESVDAVAEKAAKAEEKTRETLKQGAQTIEEKAQDAQAKWEQSAVKKYAVENPVATAGIAFAAGVLLTSILKK
jgi:ElaB/YqjD/DUF883 family membrane-anchored ribosome-binding protein